MNTLPTLNNIQGVNITTPSPGDVLAYNGTNWVNETPPAFTTIPDSVIKYEGTNLFGPGTNPGGNSNVVYGHNALISDTNSSGAVAIGAGALQSYTTISVPVTYLFAGRRAEITSVGTTDFTLLGAPSNTPGIIFTATEHGFTQHGSSGTIIPEDFSSTVAIGHNALSFTSPTTDWGGIRNTAIGAFSLESNTTGYDNTAIGSNTLRYHLTDGFNTAVGSYSMWKSTHSALNTAIGAYTLYSTTTGRSNVAVGAEALFNNTTGGDNTCVGYASLNSNTTGGNNVGIGCRSLVSNTTGNYNIAVGTTTLRSNSTGSWNIALGMGAAQNTTTGGNNVGIGGMALDHNTTGNNNISIGYLAGAYLTTGSNNVIIGGYSGVDGMADNIVLSTGNGAVRLQHDNVQWTSDTPISMTGLVLPSTTSTITLNSSAGIAGQVLTSAGPGATPVWAPAASTIAINTQGGNYTLQLSDASNTLIRMTSSSANSVTIPNDTTANLPVGSAVLISQNGTGQTTIVADAGVTIVSPETLKIGKQYGKITAIKVAANSWELEGNLAP